MTDEQTERAYKSLWHLLIAMVGIYELRNHRTTLFKILACGLIAFHADAARRGVAQWAFLLPYNGCYAGLGRKNN